MVIGCVQHKLDLPITGEMNPSTQDALRGYQRLNGQTVNGLLTNELLIFLEVPSENLQIVEKALRMRPAHFW